MSQLNALLKLREAKVEIKSKSKVKALSKRFRLKLNGVNRLRGVGPCSRLFLRRGLHETAGTLSWSLL